MKQHLKISVFNLALISMCLVLSACERNPPKPMGPTPFTIQIPPGFPTNLNIPSYNPMTYEGIRLGRYLFFEPRLSGRFDPNIAGTGMSCFTCHNPQYSFTTPLHLLNENRRVVGLPPRDGSPRVEAPTAMLPLINLVFRHEGYTWSGMVHPSNTNLGLNIPEHNIYIDTTDPRFHFRNLESFAWLMIALPHEIHGTIEESVNAIATIPEYPPLFEAAFGTPEVTIERIGKAIAQFVRTLISANSQFDRFRLGKEMLCDSAFAGWLMFESERADCFHCHGGRGNPLMTTGGFANNAMIHEDSIHLLRHDRFSFTGLEFDRGRFSIPTLRNIALTAPYMHDGRFTTLEEVIEFYSTGLKWSPTVDPNMKFVHQGGVQLTDREKRQLILFLETLTDWDFITNPAFQNPGPPR
ncbi:MAG: hypothetical protein FWD02_01525 [Bacteroidales bacterium]|nr:hypothetical protein [Bacteroidales bacterium]